MLRATGVPGSVEDLAALRVSARCTPLPQLSVKVFKRIGLVLDLGDALFEKSINSGDLSVKY
jgi:hypothetical protein